LLTPAVRRTWAPRGHTPILRHRFRWQRRSMAAALCYGSHGGGARLAFHTQPNAYDTATLTMALGELRRFLGGEKATLIWDNLPAHHRRAMRQFLARQRDWLVVEYLPAYAPELNPVEGLWANLKRVELANLLAGSVDDLARAARRGIGRIRAAWHLPYSFLHHSGLSR
jgi:transposase